MIDINLDECTTSVDKIILNPKYFNHSFKAHYSPGDNFSYSTIKCYKSLPSVTLIEIKSKNIIKIHKTIFLNLINLTSIDLSDNKLLKISKNFKLFPNLKILKLNNNQITFIPSFIGELNKLEHLSLSKNFISSIPTSIQDLTKLKYFDISSNKIENIPIEFGLLNSLNVLYIDCNYFTEIPTTLCYLKKLDELSFDWLEFINPPYYKNIKDSIGKIIITFILKTLQNILKKGILFCDFENFIKEMSIKKSNEENNDKNYNNNNNNIEISDSLLNRSGINNELKSSQFCGSSVTIKSNNNFISNNKFLKIFNAIEGGYYGVIKSMLEGENSYYYLTIKNIENRTALNYCMSKNNDLIDLFLSKIKEQKIELNYTYLFKAIKMRNPELVKKLIYLGIKVDSVDDQGKNVLHILLSVFNKNISKCILIGNFLLSFNLNLNKLDNENWGPIHFAAKRGSKECLLWIIEKNKKLEKEGQEGFDLNLKGKNDWTPLHLAVYGLRIEETLILLEYGCNIFARNIEGKTAKQVGNTNYVFSKLLSYNEILAMNNKYIDKIKNNEISSSKKNKVNDSNKKNSKRKEEDASSSLYDDTIIINNSVSINSNLFKRSITNSIKNDKDMNNINKIKNKHNLTEQKMPKMNNQNINSYLVTNQNLSNNFSNIINKKKSDLLENKSKLSNKVPNLNLNSKEKEEKNDYKHKVAYSTNNIYYNLIIGKNNYYNESENSLEQIKRKLLYKENTNLENIQYLTEIKLNKKYNNIDLIKNLLVNFVNDNQLNLLFISDICSYTIQNCLYEIIPTLKKLLTNKIIKNKNFIKQEINHTIRILEVLEKNQKIYKKKDIKELKRLLTPNSKKSNNKIFESEKYYVQNTFYKNTETKEFEDIEKININFDEMYQKTETDMNQGISDKNIIEKMNNNEKINLIKNIKLSKGNILNIDIKKLKFNQKIRRKVHNLSNISYNKIKKINAIKSKIKDK